jgi:uncharacterized membrane protein
MSGVALRKAEHMASLLVLEFDRPDGADRMLGTLQQLQSQQLIQIQDAAIVSWETGKKKPKTRQLTNMTGALALGGTFWGMLFGLLFFVPLLGAAIGAGMGALIGHFTDVGIDDNFIREVQQKVTPGTSALFLLVGHVTLDRVADALKGQQFELLQTNLSAEQEAKLRAEFAEDE